MEQINEANRREFYRINLLIPMCGDLTILAIRDKQIQKGFTPICIEDIGVGGIRCKSKLDIPENENVVFGIKFCIYGKEYILPSTIVWKKKLETSMIEYGFKFRITAEEKEAYIAMFNKFSVEVAKNVKNLYDKCNYKKKKCKYINN